MTVSAAADRALSEAGKRTSGGDPARVASMPCLEWFAEQEPSYQEGGFTAERVADAARVSLARAAAGGQAECVGIDKER